MWTPPPVRKMRSLEERRGAKRNKNSLNPACPYATKQKNHVKRRTPPSETHAAPTSDLKTTTYLGTPVALLGILRLNRMQPRGTCSSSGHHQWCGNDHTDAPHLQGHVRANALRRHLNTNRDTSQSRGVSHSDQAGRCERGIATRCRSVLSEGATADAVNLGGARQEAFLCSSAVALECFFIRSELRSDTRVVRGSPSAF